MTQILEKTISPEAPALGRAKGDFTRSAMLNKLLIRAVRSLHKIYKYTISPLFGQACRFYPYCSDYAVEAIEKHGFFKGLALAFRRIIRCNPYHPGGFDPVPEVKGLKEWKTEK